MSTRGERRAVCVRGTGGVPRGSGTTTFEKSGSGGTFQLEATAVDGPRIAGAIACGALTQAVAEGG
jgi:hypothetical protein